MIVSIIQVSVVIAALLVISDALLVYLPSAAPAGLQLQYQEEKDCVAVSFQPVQYKAPVSYVVQVATAEGKLANAAGLAYSTVRVLFASQIQLIQGFMQALLLRPLHMFSV